MTISQCSIAKKGIVDPLCNLGTLVAIFVGKPYAGEGRHKGKAT